LEAEAAELQGPSAIEMQQSAVEGMEAAGVPISDDYISLLARGSPARPGAASARAVTGWKVGGLLSLFPSLPPPLTWKHPQASLIRLSEMLRRKDTEIEVLKRTVNAECKERVRLLALVQSQPASAVPTSSDNNNQQPKAVPGHSLIARASSAEEAWCGAGSHKRPGVRAKR